MRVVAYSGYLKSGKKVRGVMVAPTVEEVKEILKKRGIYVSRLRTYPEWAVKLFPVSDKHVAIFFDGLAKLVKAGVGLGRAVELLAQDQFNPRLATVFYKLKEFLDEGLAPHEAFARTEFFPKEVVAMIKVGVESGKIEEIFGSLKEYYEEKGRIKKSFQTALAYPLLLLFVAVGTLFFVVPKVVLPLQGLFEGYSNLFKDKFELPWITKMVVGFVSTVNTYGHYMLGGFVFVVVFFFFLYRRNEAVKTRLQNFLTFVPLFGGLLHRLFIYRFLLSLDLLYKAGVPMVNALEMIEEMQRIEVFRNDVSRVREKVEKGGAFSRAIEESKYIPDAYRTLIKVGEESGQLGKTLDDLTSYARETFKAYVELVTKVMSPVALLAVAGIVGLVLLAVYMPLFEVANMLKNMR